VRGVSEPSAQSFSGAEGLEIHWKQWPCPPPSRATVVIAHGGGEHSGRYQHVAERLTHEGYGVYALDHRGHGRSQGKPGLLDRLDNAVADLGTLIAIAREALPQQDLFLLGHSMGGAIALEYALDRPQTIEALVLSAPLAKLEAASPVQLAAARLISVVAPATGIAKVDSSKVSRDPAVVTAYDEDPLVLHGKLPARTITELAAAIERFPRRLPELTLPLLVIVGAADELVPPDAARMVAELAGSADKQLIEYEGLHHEIFNEPEQDEVLDDLVAWLSRH
jgi:acylglycerol lipase